MLKKMLAVILLSSSICIAHAQTVKVSAGIRGEGIATFTGTEITPKTFMQMGGGGGIFAGIKAGNIVGLQADVLYNFHSAGYNIDMAGYSSARTKHSYIDIPICLQLWCSKGFAFEVGYQQSIALSGTLSLDGEQAVEDTGILDYGSLVAGAVINMGKVVFLNFRFTKALGYSYVMTADPSKNMTMQVGLGFRLFNSKQSVFKK